MDNNSTIKYVSMVRGLNASALLTSVGDRRSLELISPKSKKTTQTLPVAKLPSELVVKRQKAPCQEQKNKESDAYTSFSVSSPDATKKKTRLVTDTNCWLTNVTNRKINLHDSLIQWSCLTNTAEYPIIERQIQNKIRGYKSQDMDKGIYQEEQFVTYPYVYALIQEYKMRCYYCKESTMILYECVREPKQWTLERIDNSAGHNCGNVQIACLQCNLRRRTMFQEKYVLTKQMMNVTKLLG